MYPREIELQLEEHPAIREAAVVGIGDERWGEVPVAFIAVAEGTHADVRSELRAFLSGRLARYKMPKRYELVDALPRNAAGKILKRELRARASQTPERQADVPPS